MLWAGTGVLWTVARRCSNIQPDGIGAWLRRLFLYFLADFPTASVGFDKKANPNALGNACRKPSPRLKALPNKPAFMLHTGDIT